MDGNLYNMTARAQKAVTLTGKFQPQGASALIAANVVSPGLTITRIGVGLYKFAFTHRWARLLAYAANAKLTTPLAGSFAFGPIDPANATASLRFGTVQYFNAAGTAADIAASADNEITLTLVMQNQKNVNY